MVSWRWRATRPDVDQQSWSDLNDLVRLNWPFLQNTTIPVVDTIACARQGSHEQRRRAKEVRAAVERLMDLDCQHPARLELERMYRPCTCAANDLAVDSVDTTPPLPTELLIKVLHFLITERELDNAELSLFGRLRLVAKPVKELVEHIFPRTLSKYTARVVRDFLHVSHERSSVEAARLLMASKPLFERVRQLAVWYTADAEDELNSILPLLTTIDRLVLYITCGATLLGSLNLKSCVSLKSLHIDVLRLRQGVAGDIHLKKRQVHPPRNPSASGPWAPYGLKHLRVGPITQAHRTLLPSLSHISARQHLDSFDFSGSFLDREVVAALLLDLRNGPASMDFHSCKATDGAIVALDLGSKECLRKLNLRDNLVKNASVLCLRSNVSLSSVDLAFNALDSMAFGLDANHHLRHLDLTACLRHLRSEAKRGTLLQDLAEQLATNIRLEHLCLAENAITDLAARQLTLGNNKGLKVLSLVDNKLSAVGVGAVLAGSATLEEVDLRGNKGVTEQDARDLSSEGVKRIIV